MTLKISNILCGFGITLGITSCGQKGPLYLPDPPKEEIPTVSEPLIITPEEVEADEPTAKTQ